MEKPCPRSPIVGNLWVKNKPLKEKEQKQHKHIVYIDVLQQLQILTSNVDDRYGAPN